MAVILALHGIAATILITPHDGAAEVVEVKTEKGQKTLSQRLRGALYAAWNSDEQKKADEPIFEAHYSRVMERLIQAAKDKIKE
jgi:hypothetical protein